MKINWKQYTFTGKFFIILSIINLIGIGFGYIRVFTLGGYTWEPISTSFWIGLLFWLSFIFISVSVVIMFYGHLRNRKSRDNFFEEIGLVSLVMSGLLLYIVFSAGMFG